MDLPGLGDAAENLDKVVLPYNATVDPFTGSAAVRVSLPVPEGRNNATPELTLEYNSRAGNSAFGSGWAMNGLPAVSVSTTERYPSYDGWEVYSFSGVGDLAPYLIFDSGRWTQRVRDTGRTREETILWHAADTLAQKSQMRVTSFSGLEDLGIAPGPRAGPCS